MARHKRVSITCSQRIFETRCVNKKRIGWKIRDLTVIITFQFALFFFNFSAFSVDVPMFPSVISTKYEKVSFQKRLLVRVTKVSLKQLEVN